jgi:hypothetical protein
MAKAIKMMRNKTLPTIMPTRAPVLSSEEGVGVGSGVGVGAIGYHAFIAAL